jgi:hypothetical protein
MAKMTEEEFQAAVGEAIDDAQDYIDDEIAPDRIRALSYYRGDLFGNEEEGRSQVVMTEVRDTILSMMPSLMRVFMGSEYPVEFAPRRAEAVEQAEQATDYVNYVFTVDNPGFSLVHSAVKDALLLKTGVLKWWTEEKVVVEELNYPGISESEMVLLANDPEVEIKEMIEVPAETSQPDPTLPMDAPPEPIYDVKVTKKKSTKRQRVVAVPPEEFLISRNARDLDFADLVSHRCFKTLSELTEMGYDPDEVTEHGNTTSNFDHNQEAVARNPALKEVLGLSETSDEAMDRYFYTETYLRIDKDGDGIAELRKVCTVGDNHYVLHDEVVDFVPMAIFCPDPTPHMVIGSSIADQVMDLQLIKSNIIRNTLDSLAQVIHPRTGVVEGQVNMDDVLNVETGGIIRMTQPGMVQPLSEPFVGQQALPMVAYLDDIRAQRTGISKASQGLDPDVLQSTTKSAVTATMSAAQERLELIARTLAETGFRRLFRGLLREIVRHQDKPRMVRLRNQWVEMDPSAWDAEMDVIVNVGLGTGNVEQKTNLLMQVVAKQEAIMLQLGPTNPLVDISQYRAALAQLLAVNGMREASKYFKEVTPDDLKAMAQGAGQQKPDPATMVAQAEVQKIKAENDRADKKLLMDAEKERMADDRERDKAEMDFWLKTKELELKYGTQLKVEEIYAMVERERNARQIAMQAAAQQQANQMKAAQAAQQAAAPAQGSTP